MKGGLSIYAQSICYTFLAIEVSVPTEEQRLQEAEAQRSLVDFFQDLTDRERQTIQHYPGRTPDTGNHQLLLPSRTIPNSRHHVLGDFNVPRTCLNGINCLSHLMLVPPLTQVFFSPFYR